MDNQATPTPEERIRNFMAASEESIKTCIRAIGEKRTEVLKDRDQVDLINPETDVRDVTACLMVDEACKEMNQRLIKIAFICNLRAEDPTGAMDKVMRENDIPEIIENMRKATAQNGEAKK